MKKDFYLYVFLLLSLIIFPASKTKKPLIKKNKNSNKMELVFILDRSGSMSGLESDTIGGFNSVLEKQRKDKNQNGQINVTTALFDNEYELLHNKIPIQMIKPLTEKEYFVRGTTALLDAIGKTISQVKSEQNKLDTKEKSGKVLFVIITDGMENASKEYTVNSVKKLISEQKEKENWEFLFLGANIDAIKTAGSFGIDESRAAQYKSDSIGTQLNYDSINNAVKEFRSNSKLNENWKKEIENDVKKRGK